MSDMADDFKTFARAAGLRLDGPPASCPGDQELMEYHRGGLSAAGKDRVQSHLVHCASCRETLQAGADFLKTPVGAPSVSGVEVGAEWARLNARIGHDERLGSQRNRMLLVAAGFIVAIGVPLTWALSLQKGITAERTARVRLAQDSRRLQGELIALQSARQAPAVNLPVHDVFPGNTVARSGRLAATITFSSSGNMPLALLLNGAGQPEYPDHTLEIADADGRVVWSTAGVRRDANRNYTILIPPGFLSPGAYALNLVGTQGAERKHLATYRIQVN